MKEAAIEAKNTSREILEEQKTSAAKVEEKQNEIIENLKRSVADAEGLIKQLRIHLIKTVGYLDDGFEISDVKSGVIFVNGFWEKAVDICAKSVKQRNRWQRTLDELDQHRQMSVRYIKALREKGIIDDDDERAVLRLRSAWCSANRKNSALTIDHDLLNELNRLVQQLENNFTARSASNDVSEAD